MQNGKSSDARIKWAKSIFDSAGVEPSYLDFDTLAAYQKLFSPPPPYEYSRSALIKRAKTRVKNVLERIPQKNLNTFLEVGCSDGLACQVLREQGKYALSADINKQTFDGNAVEQGADFTQMDVAALGIKNETFDVVFSFNGYEHFKDPEAVLQEVLRVLKIGGYFYLDFAPLYMSPWGAHLYYQITVPYCQFLFTKESLRQYADLEHKGVLDFNSINGWSATEFKRLFSLYSDRLKMIDYHENHDTSHLDLISKHPSCFKSKTDDFSNLIISAIRVIFQTQIPRPRSGR